MKTEEYLTNEGTRKILGGGRDRRGTQTREMEVTNLPDKEFKEMVIRMLTKLEGGAKELGETFNRKLESVIKNQADLKNAITEMKKHIRKNQQQIENSLEQIRDLEDRLVEINHSE